MAIRKWLYTSKLIPFSRCSAFTQSLPNNQGFNAMVAADVWFLFPSEKLWNMRKPLIKWLVLHIPRARYISILVSNDEYQRQVKIMSNQWFLLSMINLQSLGEKLMYSHHSKTFCNFQWQQFWAAYKRSKNPLEKAMLLHCLWYL